MEITPAGVAKRDCVTSVAGIAFCAMRAHPQRPHRRFDTSPGPGCATTCRDLGQVVTSEGHAACYRSCGILTSHRNRSSSAHDERYSVLPVLHRLATLH